MTDKTNRFDQPGDEPLDPAVERVRQKMQRVQLVSLGIMFLGLAAVMAAIGYKVWFEQPESAVARPATQVPGAAIATVKRDVSLPAGAQIIDATNSGDRILLRLRVGDGQALWLIDGVSGNVISKLTLD